MGILSELLDTIEAVATGSAELAAVKWQSIVLAVVGIVFLFVFVALLIASPAAGIALGVFVVAVLYIMTDNGGILS